MFLALCLSLACARSVPVTLPPATLTPSSIAATGVPTLEATLAPTAEETTASREWPTNQWQTSTPAEQGIDGEKLGEAFQAIATDKIALHSLLIVRHGFIVSETYFGGYDLTTRHRQYSCTKSFIATLIGIAADQGYFPDLNAPVLSFFPEHTFQNVDERKRAMTLENLLTMTSGLAWDESEASYQGMFQSEDWVQYVLDLPMAAQPGSQFNYCSGCSHVLSAILAAQTGQDVYQFARKNLFAPLGITDVRWDEDAQGIEVGGWGLQLTPRDMAKLGYLYLRNGNWDGQQVVSAAWVQSATQGYVEALGDQRYGYQWWTAPRLQGYAALGRDGQTILVVPSLDLVIVTTAQTGGHGQIFTLIEKHILPAVQDAP